MGCGHSKISIIYSRKSKSKRSSKKSEAPEKSDSEEEDGTEKEKEKSGNIAEDDDDKQNQIKSSLGGPLLPPIDISTSQQDFFKMLDEKIENGPDYNSESESEILAENQRITALLKDWESASGGSRTSLNQTPPMKNSSNKDSMSNKNHIIRPKQYDFRDVLLYNSEQFNNNTIASSLQRASEIRAELGRNYGANSVQASQSIIHQNYGVALLQDPKLPQQYHQMHPPAYYHAQQEPIYPPYAQQQQPTQPYAQQVQENYSAHPSYPPQTQQGFSAQIAAPQGYAQYLGYPAEQQVSAPPAQYRQVYANYVMHQPSPGPPQHVLSYPTQYQVISPLYSSQSNPTPRQHNLSYTMKTNPGNIPGSGSIPGNPPSYPIKPSGPGNPLVNSGNLPGGASIPGNPPSYPIKPSGPGNPLVNSGNIPGSASIPGNPPLYPIKQSGSGNPSANSGNIPGNASILGNPSPYPIKSSDPRNSLTNSGNIPESASIPGNPPSYPIKSSGPRIPLANSGNIPESASIPGNPPSYPIKPSGPGNPPTNCGNSLGNADLSGSPGLINRNQLRPLSGQPVAPAGQDAVAMATGGSSNLATKCASNDVSKQPRTSSTPIQTRGPRENPQSQFQKINPASGNYVKTNNNVADHSQMCLPAANQGHYQNPDSLATNPVATQIGKFDTKGHYQNTTPTSVKSVDKTNQQKRSLYGMDQSIPQLYSKSDDSPDQGHYQNTGSLSDNSAKMIHSFVDKQNPPKGTLYVANQDDNQGHYQNTNLLSGNSVKANFTSVDRTSQQKRPLYELETAQSPLQSGGIPKSSNLGQFDSEGHYQNTTPIAVKPFDKTSQQKRSLYGMDQATPQLDSKSDDSTNQGHYQNTDSLSENPVKSFLDKTNLQKGPLYGVDQATLKKNFAKSNSDSSKPKGPLYGVDLATLQSNVANRIQKNLANVDKATPQTNFVKKGPLYGVDQTSLQNNAIKTNHNVADHLQKVQKVPTFAEKESSDTQAQNLESNFQKMSVKGNKQLSHVEQTKLQKVPANNSDAHAQYPPVTFQTVPILVKNSNEVTYVPKKNLAGRNSPD